MIEAIRTFFGRVRGQHREKETVVVQGELWYCTDCKMIFLNKKEAEKHVCSERL
jgi:uncharacterized C2H2 Zn-finger protein